MVMACFTCFHFSATFPCYILCTYTFWISSLCQTQNKHILVSFKISRADCCANMLGKEGAKLRSSFSGPSQKTIQKFLKTDAESQQ